MSQESATTAGDKTLTSGNWYWCLRALLHRAERWQAVCGPALEVMFLKEQHSGVLGISDFF
jgi:hypothetical protein